jgi:hypothetical protein
MVKEPIFEEGAIIRTPLLLMLRMKTHRGN